MLMNKNAIWRYRKKLVIIFNSIFAGILKVTPANQMLFNKDNQVMEDEKTLNEYGLTPATAKAQSPSPIGLALRFVDYFCVALVL